MFAFRASRCFGLDMTSAHLLPFFKNSENSCGIIMPTPHTLVIYGTIRIEVYHVPDIDLSTTRSDHISITPVYSWLERVFPPLGWHHVPSIWNASSKEPPLLRIVSNRFIRTIHLKGEANCTRLRIRRHLVDLLKVPAEMRVLIGQQVVTKCRKGLWYHVDRNASTLEVPTINFGHPSRIGSIKFPLTRGKDSKFVETDFDEVSGRFVLVSSLRNSPNLWKYQVGDVIKGIPYC